MPPPSCVTPTKGVSGFGKYNSTLSTIPPLSAAIQAFSMVKKQVELVPSINSSALKNLSFSDTARLNKFCDQKSQSDSGHCSGCSSSYNLPDSDQGIFTNAPHRSSIISGGPLLKGLGGSSACASLVSPGGITMIRLVGSKVSGV